MSTEKKIMTVLALAAMLTTFTVAVALMAVAGALSLSPWCYQALPLMFGGMPSAFGWGMPAGGFYPSCSVPSLPLYFGAHGFGFPMTLGNFRIGFIPSL